MSSPEDNNDKGHVNTYAEYDSLVEQARKRTLVASKDYIPRCCELLKKEGLSQEKIVHRIRRDFSEVWSIQTIYEAIPDEYKKETKPKKDSAPPESILIEQSSSSGTVQVTEPHPDPEPEEFHKQLLPSHQSTTTPPLPTATVTPTIKHQKIEIAITFANILWLQNEAAKHRNKVKYIIEYDIDIKEMIGLRVV